MLQPCCSIKIILRILCVCVCFFATPVSCERLVLSILIRFTGYGMLPSNILLFFPYLGLLKVFIARLISYMKVQNGPEGHWFGTGIVKSLFRSLLERSSPNSAACLNIVFVYFYSFPCIPSLCIRKIQSWGQEAANAKPQGESLLRLSRE